jgi:16S rRNA (cytosine967-C5)-methyltransferase
MHARTGTGTAPELSAAPAGARDAALRIVAGVLGGRAPFDQLLDDPAGMPADDRDRALVSELAYGVMRWHPRLEFIAARLLRHPLKRSDADVQALLLLGLHQVFNMRVAPHAAVSESVECARRLGKPWAAALVNAVLRRALRERGALLEAVQRDAAALHSHPAWLAAAIRRDWPDQWQRVLDANNTRAPMDLRVNPARVTRDDYRELLHAQGIAAGPLAGIDTGLRLAAPIPVAALPKFDAGFCSVQDAAAQLAAPLLDALSGHRVLDACAAPGGKCCHILERSGGVLELIALDRDRERLPRIQENLQRTGLPAVVIAGDATRPGDWWDGRPFDRILLDAPCSASGVIRRHPDIKVVRRAGHVKTAVAAQRQLLACLWPLLATGGRLLYCTCSVLRAENDAQIENFAANHKDAVLLPVRAAIGAAARCGWQTLPGRDDSDGFYYALLEKH